MKLIIAGSRDLIIQENELNFIFDVLEVPIDNITEVVSGGAKGIDTAGEVWAFVNGVDCKRFNADWAAYGKAAGPKRNYQMGEYADMAVVIMKPGGSRGSQHMINVMKKLNKPVYVYEYEGAGIV